MTEFVPFDPDGFHYANVVDTCAVWNVFSSLRLAEAAFNGGLRASITGVVRYECLHKPRKTLTQEDTELQRRLRCALDDRTIRVDALEIEDLQQVDILHKRKRLGRGELSSIVFAQKTGVAILSDDDGAVRFAAQVLGSAARSQSTPWLLGSLVFRGILDDADVEHVVAEHRNLRRSLEPRLRRAVEWTRECQGRLANNGR